MKKIITLLLFVIFIFLFITCNFQIVQSNPRDEIGKAYIVDNNGIKIKEVSAIYRVDKFGMYILIREDGTLYKP